MHGPQARPHNLLYGCAAIVTLAGSLLAASKLADGMSLQLALYQKQFEFILLGIATLSLFSVITLARRIEVQGGELVNAKSDFIAIASHELRSPLTGIRWNLAMLRNDTSLEPNVRDVVNDIHRRVCALIDLTSTFLLSTSADHGVMRSTDFKLFNMAKVVSEAIAHAQSFSMMKQMKITSDIEPMASISIKGDAARLRLIFDNLISNAIKYSPNGTTVSISYEDHGSTKVFKIHDQGIGIPQDELKRVFSGFHRAENARKTGVVGSGFGLYMAKKIAKFHGGDITCTSEAGKGTTFIVSLPSGV